METVFLLGEFLKKYAAVPVIHGNYQFESPVERNAYVIDVKQLVESELQKVEKNRPAANREPERWFNILFNMALEENWSFEKLSRKVGKCLEFIAEEAGAAPLEVNLEAEVKPDLKAKKLEIRIDGSELVAHKVPNVSEVDSVRCDLARLSVKDDKEAKAAKSDMNSKKHQGLRIRTDNDENVIQNVPKTKKSTRVQEDKKQCSRRLFNE